MSTPIYPGSSFFSGSFGSCPPPQECCCDCFWEIRPGDTAPRTIDVTNWMSQNMGDPAQFNLNPIFETLTITEMDSTTPMTWPVVAQPPVVLPLAVGGIFTIEDIKPYVDRGRHGYGLRVVTSKTAALNKRYRLDYSFTVSNACDGKFVGTGCVLIIVRKCFFGAL